MVSIVAEILGFGSRPSSRNLALLVVLGMTIAMLPLFDYLLWLQDATLAVVLVMCVRSVSTTRGRAIAAWSLAAAPLLSLALFNFVPPWLEALGRLLTLPFFLYTVVVLIRQLMTARSAGSGELYAAASTYLLLGLTWGILYIFLEGIAPGSFSFPDHDAGDGDSLFYFSYVTLVTLGYGEITPVSEVARSFSIIEAITGSLFLTILVARLVGLFTGAQRQEREEESDGESVDA